MSSTATLIIDGNGGLDASSSKLEPRYGETVSVTIRQKTGTLPDGTYQLAIDNDMAFADSLEVMALAEGTASGGTVTMQLDCRTVKAAEVMNGKGTVLCYWQIKKLNASGNPDTIASGTCRFTGAVCDEDAEAHSTDPIRPLIEAKQDKLTAGLNITITGNTISASPSTSVYWADIQGKPSTFTPSAHAHSMSDVTGLQTALDGKENAGAAAGAVSAHAGSATAHADLFSAKQDALTAGENITIEGGTVSVVTGEANGVAGLGSDGKVPASQLPPMSAGITVAACTDMGIVIGENSVEVTFGDPDNVVLSGATLATWQRTVAVLKNGSFPTGPSDGTIILATSRNPQTDTYPLPSGVSFALKNAYKTASQQVAVPSGNTACIKLFSYTTAEEVNNLSANEFPTYTSYSWAQLAEYADAGTFLQHIPLGSALDMENSDYPGHKWLVIDTDLFIPTNQSVNHTVSLLSQYVFGGTPADSAETQWAVCDDSAAVTGIVYGLNVSGTMVTLTEGTHWNAGDTSCTYDGTVYPIARWYEKNPDTSYSSGTNYTPQRNDVQWMNAEQGAGLWFTKQNKWDACTYTNKHGFMHGLPESFKGCIVESARTNYVYTSYRKRGIGSSVTWNAKVFPLSICESHATVQGGVQEGKRKAALFQSDASYLKGYPVGSETAQIWWLSSANTVNANNVMYVSASGTATSGNANSAYCSRPACSFGKINN